MTINQAVDMQNDLDQGRTILGVLYGYDPDHPDIDNRIRQILEHCHKLPALATGKRDCPWLTPLQSARASVAFIAEQIGVIAQRLGQEPEEPCQVIPQAEGQDEPTDESEAT